MRDFRKLRTSRWNFSRRRKKKFFSNLFVIVSALIAISVFATIGVFAWYAKDLPNPAKVQRKSGFSTIIYDRNGKVLYDIFADQNRVPIEINDIPKTLEQATVAVEDKDFYKHQGYSYKGMIRAFFQILFFRNLQGGSTLTQQLVKNVLLTQERTLPRKIKEFILAVQIERKYTKEQILQMYLNEAPYGGTIWGVEVAAENYFGKKARDLTLSEAAFLAGLPQNPSNYSPYVSESKAYIDRSKHVLRRMREDGYITKAQEEAANGEIANMKFSSENASFKAPHFVMYVKKKLEEQFGTEMVEKGGLRVTTTLDLNIQDEAEKIVKEEVDKLTALKVSNGAAVAIDPRSGEILMMVGSKDYNDEQNGGKFNVVTQGLRQPGSAIKPITYATAFEKNYTPATLIMDVATEFPGVSADKPYKPENYDGKFHGPIQLRFALGNSINIPAVKLLAMVGVKDMLTTASNMGLTTLKPTTENINRFGLSITLGGGEVYLLDLTSAFGVFGSSGIKYDPVAILKVEDNSHHVLYEYKKTSGSKVLSPEVSFLISHILSDNNARKDVFGPNSWLNIPGKTVAVKTGTTDDKRDNWTVGYTKEIAVGVWVGNNDNSAMDKKLASGITGAAPIWNRIMKIALKSNRDGIPDKPDNVVAMEIDSLGGGLPKDGQGKRAEYFIKGTEPTTLSPIYQKLKLSRKESGKLANQDEINAGQYDEKDYIVFAEDDPVSFDGKNRWQEGINKWIDTQPEPMYHVPRETSGAKIEPTSPPQPTAAPTAEKKEATPTVTLTPTP